jgi:hypothetical protein
MLREGGNMSDRTYAKVQVQQKTLSGSSPRSSLLQRTCACGQHTIAGAQCSTCRSEQSTLHRSQRTFGSSSTSAVTQGNSPAQENVLPFNAAADRVSRFGHDFSNIPIHSSHPPVLQTKLKINQPGDIYEQEADQVAEQVMRTPEPQLQRACACGGACPECRAEQPGREHESLQTERVQASDTGQIAAPPIVHEVLRSPGQPLDMAARAFMESRFGHDFSRVRVHADGEAADAARAVRARAYTIGQDIVFGTGEYAPTTVESKRLLAHELVHVVQQTSGVWTQGASAVQRPEPKDARKKMGSEPEVQRKEDDKPDAGKVELPKEEKPKEEKKEAKEIMTNCEKKYPVESWGQDTCCSRRGFMDNEAVNIKDGKTKSSCNKWPLFLALHAKEHDLEGVASCKPSKLGQKAQIKVGVNTLTVGCIDARANEDKMIEIDAEAAQVLFNSKNVQEDADEVCYGGSFETCKFETHCHPFPKETWCLPVGITKKETDSPAKHGWHKR